MIEGMDIQELECLLMMIADIYIPDTDILYAENINEVYTKTEIKQILLN